MLGEPADWTQARRARLAAKYPAQFVDSDAQTVVGVDAFNVARGMAPSPFSVTAMKLAPMAARSKSAE